MRSEPEKPKSLFQLGFTSQRVSGEGNEVVFLEMQSEIDPLCSGLPSVCFERNSQRTVLTCWKWWCWWWGGGGRVQRLASRRMFSLSASLSLFRQKRWDPVDARLTEGWKSIRETHIASQIPLPNSYSCIPFALAVLTRWGVGVQPCLGGGWRVHAGCGSFWHLHSWAGRIASPDWNLSVDGIRWQPAQTKLGVAQACLRIQLCALCVCVCVCVFFTSDIVPGRLRKPPFIHL